MLTELNRDTPTHRAAAAEPVPVAAAAEEPPPADDPDELDPEPLVKRDHADTAMLLRELSSLGFSDDDDRPAPTPPQTPRPVASSYDPKKKRKGLFGRG
jgi:hypothetical protein